MSSALYRNAVEKILFEGLFSGYDKLAEELGVAEEDLRQGLSEDGGKDLTTLIKFKILSLTGVNDLRAAIQIVETDEMSEPIDVAFIDRNTGLVKWLDALESLKKSAGFIEDKELSAYLGIPPSTLSDFRRGKAEVSSRIKLRILDHLGFHRIASGIEFLLRDETAAASKRARQRQARKIAEQRRVPEET